LEVKTEDEFRGWLHEHPSWVCNAVAYRAALRVLPLTLDAASREGAARLALAALRAVLTSGSSAKKQAAEPSETAKFAALRASISVQDALRAARSPSGEVSFSASAAMATAFGVYSDYSVENAVRVVSMARGALWDYGAAYTSIQSAIFEDTVIGLDDLLTSPVDCPTDVADAISPFVEAPESALNLDGPWVFWGQWYKAAKNGTPLAWELQEAVSLIPSEIWDAGAEAVANEIGSFGMRFAN
jgi:hypothetical protein